VLIDVILPALTAIRAASIAWHLARTQKQTEWLAAIAKLKTALRLERQKQRNHLLVTQLELANAKLQFEATLRSAEVATLKACLPQQLSPQLEGSAFPTISQILDSAFREGQGSLEAQIGPIKARKRISASPLRPASAPVRINDRAGESGRLDKASFDAGIPIALFDAHIAPSPNTNVVEYGVTADRKRFLIDATSGPAAAPTPPLLG
jgi:hypothetical protein